MTVSTLVAIFHDSASSAPNAAVEIRICRP
jgi:hypothetical protein